MFVEKNCTFQLLEFSASTWSCQFFMISNFFGLIFYLYSALTNRHFFESLSHGEQSMTVILIYNEVFWEISWNNFNHFFPTFGLAEFVYILRQCYQFAFLYCKIGQISTLIFGQNLQKSPQRRSTVFTITKIKIKRNQYKRGMDLVQK